MAELPVFGSAAVPARLGFNRYADRAREAPAPGPSHDGGTGRSAG